MTATVERKVPGTLDRLMYVFDIDEAMNYGEMPWNVTLDPEHATLVSSQLRRPRREGTLSIFDSLLDPEPDYEHAPVLDIDLPCALVESSTPGHYHLYIDKPMPWSDYRLLLDVLAKVGIVEEGYAAACIEKHQASFVRTPWTLKEDAA